MKTLKHTLAILFTLSVFLTNAQSVSLPSAMILTAPLNVVENSGSSFGSFTFAESSSVAVTDKVSNTPNILIEVKMQYVTLTDLDTSLVTGTLLEHFDVSFNADTNTLLFEQNGVIPGDWFGTAKFPMSVIQNSSRADSLNGFNVTLTALDENTNTYGTLASVYTYTEASEVTSSDEEIILDNLTIYPIPTDKILHIDNTDASLLNISVYDIKGSLVFKEDLNNLNNSINLEKLAEGVYYLKIYDTINDSTSNTKFILN